jgi:hypothetical protein
METGGLCFNQREQGGFQESGDELGLLTCML